MKKIKRTFGFILTHPLSGKHFFRSLFRFALWQVQRKLSPNKYIVKDFIKPVKFYARQGLTGITGNLYTGLHEFEAMGFLLHFLREGDTFFDIGANVGSYTLLAAGNCKANAVTIEPIPSAFRVLSDNITLNKLENKVKLVNAGAGDTNDPLVFTADLDAKNHVVMPGEVCENTVEIPTIKIDDLVTEVPVLVKMDVEGFESRVLNGMTELLKQEGFKALIIEMSDTTFYGFDDNYTHGLLTAHGFSPFIYEPYSRELTAVTSFDYENIVYCRDMDFITKRLKNAPKIKLLGELF